MNVDANPGSPIGGTIRETTYLIYVDDSGNDDIDVLAALLVPIEFWGPVIGYWKAHRRSMNRLWDIPPSVEFHSVDIARRAGDKLLDYSTLDEDGDPKSIPYPQEITLEDGSKRDRTNLFASAVDRISGCNTGDRTFGVGLLVCAAHQANGKAGLYEPLMRQLDGYLKDGNAWGIVWHDGTHAGKATVLRKIHRNMAARERRIVEDAVPMDSSQSHFVQMADICAYTAFKHLEFKAGDETRTTFGEMFSRLDGLNLRFGDGDGEQIHMIQSENEKGPQP